MNFKALIILTLVSFFSTACLFENEPDSKVDDPTKEEIEKRKQDGDTKDYCDIFDWYGDGTCDSFCIEKDSDCDVNCKAAPACGPDTIEVSKCEDSATCKEVSICGSTIYCEAAIVCLDGQDAAPVQCPADYRFGTKCDSSDPEHPCIDNSSPCGGPSFCNYDPAVSCLAIPVCAEDELQVENCKSDDTTCKEISECNTTISCVPKQDCEAVPTCGSEPEYASRIECEKENDICREEYLCSTLIYCGGE